LGPLSQEIAAREDRAISLREVVEFGLKLQKLTLWILSQTISLDGPLA
jgi:hypothetical protein